MSRKKGSSEKYAGMGKTPRELAQLMNEKAMMPYSLPGENPIDVRNVSEFFGVDSDRPGFGAVGNVLSGKSVSSPQASGNCQSSA